MYKFIKTRDKDNAADYSEVEMTVDAIVIEDLLEAFEDFVLACGFRFKDNEKIGITEDEG